ncbi:hypothetical protein J6590_085727 [Homalodisca vitripennis]|nr:hypothetical protein J6590_085727 [Homalodisca vitripennis]
MSCFRAKKPSLTFILKGDLKVTSEPTPMAGQVGCLQGQDRSAGTHLSNNHARRCLIRLSCCIRYTAPLARAYFISRDLKRSKLAIDYYKSVESKLSCITVSM